MSKKWKLRNYQVVDRERDRIIKSGFDIDGKHYEYDEIVWNGFSGLGTIYDRIDKEATFKKKHGDDGELK